MNLDLSRRRFVQLLAALWAGAAARGSAQGNHSLNSFSAATVNRKNVVAIQVKPYAWLDEGIDQILDNLQEKGNVNTVFAFTFLPDPTDQSGRIPLPDHGTFGKAHPDRGGASYDYDLKYFQKTTLKEFHSPDRFNVISQVAPKMKARGMDFFAFDYNNSSAAMVQLIPGLTEVCEIDIYGRRTDSACFNNPDYRAHLTGKVESYLSGYPSEVDGIAWGCERGGPLDNLFAAGWNTTGISCFCRYCCAKAREGDISINRARTGLIKLDQLFHAANKQRPTDGYFVTFWRTLLEYPEILSWQQLWHDSYHEVRAEVYGTAKTLAPKKPFGFHIVQKITFSPFYSAADDYSKIRNYADFIKIATYSNAGGARMADYLRRMCQTVFADATPEDLLPFYYKVMNYDEKSYAEIQKNGLSVDYLARETRRAIADTGGAVQVYPGVDIDVPVGPGQHKTTPESVKTEVHAAFNAGADGVVLSREYTEMWLANLAAAGEATRQIFAKG
jgi:hypothetical protein